MAFGKILRPVFDPGLAVAPWWKVAGKTCVAAYQPKGAASLAASYVNLANPGTYDAAPGAAPTLTADGWSFNGTQYLVVAGLVQNRPLTMLVSASQSSSDGGGLLWTADATKNRGVAIGIGTTFDTADNVVSALSATISAAWLSSTSTVNIAGFVIGIALNNGAHNVSAPYVLYLDGNPVKSGNVAVFDTATDFNIAAIGARGVSATIKSVVIYSSTLTAGEVAAVSSAMSLL